MPGGTGPNLPSLMPDFSFFGKMVKVVFHLHAATAEGNLAVVARLLQAGAIVDCQALDEAVADDLGDETAGWTPLHLAATSTLPSC